MAPKIYNRFNFYRHTFCVFREAYLSAIENKTVDYKSKSGSSYYFTEIGVYRLSNHWGRAANCKWRLESHNSNTSRTKLGFALWTDFHTDNDTEKLYFITVDFENQTVHYQHKDSTEYNDTLILRSAPAVTKTIKEIRNLFENESWAKHYDIPMATLRSTIIHKLLTTDTSLLEIKRALH